jgi:catechol 2,3-dioxygenase-like lactoylglutathione lyase family enzyme
MIGRKRCFRVCLAALLVSLTGISPATEQSTAEADPAPAPRPLVRIDHIPLAVRDLDRAVDTYQRLGFTIKPGRFHTDGIRNMHVKFANGAGIELITAGAPTDDLTRYYLTLLAQGEGPAFVGFYTPDLTALKGRLDQSGIPYKLDNNILRFSDPALAWPFVFDTLNLAPNEKPEYFEHPNTATATLGIWIAGGDQARMLKLFKALGARIERRRVYVPDAVLADVATVADGGEAIFLPTTRQILPGRPIVGIVFQTKDLNALNRDLRSGGVIPASKRETRTYRSTFIAPRDTRGVWLEFREPR